GLELVGTALGDHVDHAAQRAAELGAVAAGLGLLLGDGLVGDLGEVEVPERIADVETVEVVLVLGHRGAAERGEVAEGVVATHGARRQQRDRHAVARHRDARDLDRKSTRLNSSHVKISYAVFCLKKKKKKQ